jgi:NAD-dependent dihydropyrimidine dehydrogenase PreA subunit
MSKNWYPMINYENCIECGSCFDMCQHGVYKKEDNKPVAVYPEGCIEGCHGCQSQCPAEAITYFGDNGEKESGGCGCGSCG